MKTTTTAILAALILGAGAARAVAADADASFEDRFHEAYVTEVIEGRVADAAKVYLELMEADAAPARIRAESKFRFAVCAALLGRADEAASHLGALIADPATPDDLRARAKAYLDTVEGIGVGSELTKKLESLVFELGRASPDAPEPDVYRDFEVIGKPAIPFLRKLLGHPDVKIRRHAFRLLARLGADGLSGAWTPQIGLDGDLTRELGRWLDAHEGDRPELEGRLLQASDDALVLGASGLVQLTPLSEEFVRALADRDTKDLAANLAAQDASRTELEWPVLLLLEWIRGRPGVLGDRATTELLRLVEKAAVPIPETPGVFATVVGRPVLRSGRLNDSVAMGLRRWASEVSPAVVLAEMKLLLDPNSGGEPRYLLDLLADGLDHRLDEVDLDDYTELVKRSLATTEPSLLRSHLPPLFAALPEEPAVELARFVFGRVDDYQWSDALPLVLNEKYAAVLIAAYGAAPRELRSYIAARLHLFNAGNAPPGTPAEMARIQLETLEHLLIPGDFRWLTRTLGRVGPVLAMLPEEEAAKRLVSLVRAAVEAFPREKGALTGIGNSVPVAIFLRAAPELADLFGRDEGRQVVGRAMVFVEMEPGLDPALRSRLARFVLDHLDLLPSNWWDDLAADPGTFPPEDWVPEAPASAVHRLGLEPDRAAEVARHLTEDPGYLTRSTLLFVQEKAPREVSEAIAKRLFAETTGELRQQVYDFLRWQLPPEVVQVALDEQLSSESPDLPLVQAFAEDLAARSPSPELFPAVRFLLGSDRNSMVLAGIDIAQKLGREELLPALAGKLDSMVPSIREKAKAAMDSILELKRLRSEYEK